MSTNETKPTDDQKTINEERLRLTKLVHEKREELAAKYRVLINHTSNAGQMLTSSMVYAYSKGINDVIKLLTQEIDTAALNTKQTEVKHEKST